MSKNKDSGIDTREKLKRMIFGASVFQAIYAVTNLGIIDLLYDQPKTCPEIAELLSLDEDRTKRLLEMLSVLELFHVDEQNRYALTELSCYLAKKHPQSMHHIALIMGSNDYFAWSKLDAAVKDGGCAFELYYKKPLFEHLQEEATKQHLFSKAMTEWADEIRTSFIEKYDLSPYHSIADVGGAYGELIGAILENYSDKTGILFDQETVIAEAKKQLSHHTYYPRLQFVSGDFFTAIPCQADLYCLKFILHDWPDDKCVQLLNNLKKVMPAHARVVILETFNELNADTFMPKLWDVSMMVMLGAKERTKAQYQSIFEQSGFEINNIITLTSQMNLMELKPLP